MRQSVRAGVVDETVSETVSKAVGKTRRNDSAPVRGNLRSRRLLLLERTMYREGRTPFTSVFTIQLFGRLQEGRLREALVRLQGKHPLLRCVIEEGVDSEGPRFVLQDRPAPIPLRVVERKNDDHWQTEVRREWVAPFDASRDPLVRLVWLRGSEVSELILVGHHCICDGQSGMTLLRDCLSAYDEPEKDLGTYDALGTIEDLVPAALLEDRRFRRRIRWKIGLLRLIFLWERRKRARSVSPIRGEQIYFHRWSLDKGASLALTERCREEGVTVLAAMSVAFLQAFREVRGTRALRNVYTMVNARKFMPLLRPDAMFGVAPGVKLSMKGLPLPQEMSARGFWTCAQAIKANLTRQVDVLGRDIFDYLVGMEGMHNMYGSLVGDTKSATAVRHLTLSNMGRLEFPQRYSSFWVETIYSPLVMISPTPANTVVISSFAGCLELAIVSDEQSLPPVQAKAIRRRAMDILRDCAGIPTQYQSGLADEPSACEAKTR
jgi:Condensation domain